MPFIPLWLRIAGPLVGLLLIGLLIGAWGNGRYNSGKRAGVEQTDDKWLKASEKLKQDAATTATRADDAAAVRLDRQVEQVAADQEKIDEANRNGTSPLDALFGG